MSEHLQNGLILTGMALAIDPQLYHYKRDKEKAR